MKKETTVLGRTKYYEQDMPNQEKEGPSVALSHGMKATAGPLWPG